MENEREKTLLTLFSLLSGEDGIVRVWDLGSGDILKEYKPMCSTSPSSDKGAITSLSYSPDGNLLASGNHRNQISVWNMKTLLPPAAATTK